MDELEGTAASVASGPPCRVCGFPIERGWLVVHSGASLSTTVHWHDPDGTRPAIVGREVESFLWGPTPSQHGLPGYRCPECRRMDVGYSVTFRDIPPPAAPPLARSVDTSGA